MKLREIKTYCIKVIATSTIQQQYKEIIQHFYNRLNMDKDKNIEMEFYIKSSIEPQIGGKFVIWKSPDSKVYHEKW